MAAGTETMIAHDTSELCYRGRHIFMGYMYMQKQSEDAFDVKGFLRSGDIAEIDEPSGFIRITGSLLE